MGQSTSLGWATQAKGMDPATGPPVGGGVCACAAWVRVWGGWIRRVSRWVDFFPNDPAHKHHHPWIPVRPYLVGRIVPALALLPLPIGILLRRRRDADAEAALLLLPLRCAEREPPPATAARSNQLPRPRPRLQRRKPVAAAGEGGREQPEPTDAAPTTRPTPRPRRPNQEGGTPQQQCQDDARRRAGRPLPPHDTGFSWPHLPFPCRRCRRPACPGCGCGACVVFGSQVAGRRCALCCPACLGCVCIIGCRECRAARNRSVEQAGRL